MYVCIYMCVYIYMYVYIYVYVSMYVCVYMYTISFLFFNIKSKIISLIIIGGQLDEIVFFLVAFGIVINLIFLLFIFVQTDCLCCVGNKYYYSTMFVYYYHIFPHIPRRHR